MVPGPNYEGLFRHYAVEKPVIARVRASTLPSSNSSGNSNDANIVNNRNSVLGIVSAREVADEVPQQQQQHRPRLQPLSLPVAAEAVDLVLGEEVVLGESLRDTQIGLPVILVGVEDESLRRTQLGVPVEVEIGRVSEPAPETSSHFNDIDFISHGSDASQQIPQLSPPSPQRSDLYLDLPDAPVKSGSGGGVEKLYHTYLERREKLQTAAADKQQLRNTRLEVSRVHQQQQQERRARVSSSSCSSGGDVAMFSTSSNQTHHDRDAFGPVDDEHQPQQAYRLLYQPHRLQSNQSEAPTKQHFRFDLYAQP